MATEIELHLRNGVTVPVHFGDDEEGWQIKDTERVVLVLDASSRPRAVVNLSDFVHATVTETDDGG